MNEHGQQTLAGQRTVVTGAASGIGEATARRFAKAGAELVLGDIHLEKAEAVATSIRAEGACAYALQADVADSSQVDGFMKRASELLNGVDVLVHSAGIGVEREMLKTTDAEWRKVIDIDLSGTFYVLRAAGRLMADAGYGRIITMSSTAGMRGGSRRAAYGAAKAGVIMLTRVLAVELAEKNVTVNCLAPGAIDTALVKEMHSAETRKVYEAAIPAKKYGLPEDVANAALFLASRDSHYITGHVLSVDGGFLAAGLIIR